MVEKTQSDNATPSDTFRNSSNKKHFFANRPSASPVASQFGQTVQLLANSYKLQLKTGK